MRVLVEQQTHPKVMTNMLKKVFNWSEVHLFEMDFYKICTLGTQVLEATKPIRFNSKVANLLVAASATASCNSFKIKG